MKGEENLEAQEGEECWWEEANAKERIMKGGGNRGGERKAFPKAGDICLFH